MTLRLLSLSFRQLLGWLALLTRRSATSNVELRVLRQEVAVLHRQVTRSRLVWGARAVLAGLARRLPRYVWYGFLVRPTTLLGWPTTWSSAGGRAHTVVGRPGVALELRGLVLRLARDNRPELPPHPRRTGPTRLRWTSFGTHRVLKGE